MFEGGAMFKLSRHTLTLKNASGTHTGPPKSCKTIYYHLGNPEEVDRGVFRVFRWSFI